jgi:hypothetical protein
MIYFILIYFSKYKIYEKAHQIEIFLKTSGRNKVPVEARLIKAEMNAKYSAHN